MTAIDANNGTGDDGMVSGEKLAGGAGTLGGTGLVVSRIGYGAMRLCGQPGNFGPFADWSSGEKLLRRAGELGVNFFDTAEAYGPGHNEEIIASALHPYRDRSGGALVVATKGGVTKT